LDSLTDHVPSYSTFVRAPLHETPQEYRCAQSTSKRSRSSCRQNQHEHLLPDEGKNRAKPKQATTICLAQLLFIPTTSDLSLAAEGAAEALWPMPTPHSCPDAQSLRASMPFMCARAPHRNPSFVSVVAKAKARRYMETQDAPPNSGESARRQQLFAGAIPHASDRKTHQGVGIESKFVLLALRSYASQQHAKTSLRASAPCPAIVQFTRPSTRSLTSHMSARAADHSDGKHWSRHTATTRELSCHHDNKSLPSQLAYMYMYMHVCIYIYTCVVHCLYIHTALSIRMLARIPRLRPPPPPRLEIDIAGRGGGRKRGTYLSRPALS
jgi:hypothetical protein